MPCVVVLFGRVARLRACLLCLPAPAWNDSVARLRRGTGNAFNLSGRRSEGEGLRCNPKTTYNGTNNAGSPSTS